MRRFSEKSRRAFTLVELLAVIGIIAVMATVIGVSLGGGNATTSLGSSQRIAAGIFQSARSIAVLKQTKTRVLIYGSNGADTDAAKYLRFMQVIYYTGTEMVDDGSGTPTPQDIWVAANAGTYLPQGVYYYPQRSDFTDSQVVVESDNTGTTAVTFRPTETSTVRVRMNAYVFQFDSNGLFSNMANNKVVFAAGSVGGYAGDIPELVFDNPYAVTGFYIRRTGSVSLAEYNDLD